MLQNKNVVLEVQFICGYLCVCVCVCTCVCSHLHVLMYVYMFNVQCLFLCILSMGIHQMTPFFDTSVKASTQEPHLNLAHPTALQILLYYDEVELCNQNRDPQDWYISDTYLYV